MQPGQSESEYEDDVLNLLQLQALYKSCMDVETLNKRGFTPLEVLLQAAKSLKSSIFFI